MGPMLAVLLSGGLFVTRHETLSASLAVACARGSSPCARPFDPCGRPRLRCHTLPHEGNRAPAAPAERSADASRAFRSRPEENRSQIARRRAMRAETPCPRAAPEGREQYVFVPT